MWPALEAGRHLVEVGDRRVEVDGDGGPAAADVDGLPPGTRLDVLVDGRPVARATTLAPPPGEALCRLATVSDIHLGDGWTFGILPEVRDPSAPADLPNPRAATAATRELRAWGAELLLVKGDVTHHGRREEWEQAAELLGGVGVPVVATRGNHDVRPGHVDARGVLGEAGVALAAGDIVVRDLPGLRVVVVDATRRHRHTGSLEPVRADVLDAVAAAEGPALLAMHHQLQRLPFPTHWPPGVLGPESGRFLRSLRRANPDVLVTSGHTHRHRARRIGPLVVTEVGSPKDHPGTWAGYVVHEGGIRQVVRRVADPRVLRWTEDTKRALFGVWGRWSPGRLEDRCFSHTWTGGR